MATDHRLNQYVGPPESYLAEVYSASTAACTCRCCSCCCSHCYCHGLKRRARRLLSSVVKAAHFDQLSLRSTDAPTLAPFDRRSLPSTDALSLRPTLARFEPVDSSPPWLRLLPSTDSLSLRPTLRLSLPLTADATCVATANAKTIGAAFATSATANAKTIGASVAATANAKTTCAETVTGQATCSTTDDARAKARTEPPTEKSRSLYLAADSADYRSPSQVSDGPPNRASH